MTTSLKTQTCAARVTARSVDRLAVYSACVTRAVDRPEDQTRWGLSSRSDREGDPAEAGIGDLDGLLEQIGNKDGQGGGIF